MLDTQLLTPGDRVLVAVSGGVDSLALLHQITARREELRIEVVAGHVHHGMRGAAADADVEFLERICAGWNVPLAVERVDVPAYAAKQRISAEEAGRTLRYRCFERLAHEHRCTKVATAHHADDQAETVLLNLRRGAGLDGLAGIPPRRWLNSDVEVIRPLLGVWRRELEAYCRQHGLEPRDDATNLDLRFRRNRVRAEVLPFLERWDPRIRDHLVRLADQARGEAELLNHEAANLLAQARIPPLPFREEGRGVGPAPEATPGKPDSPLPFREGEPEGVGPTRSPTHPPTHSDPQPAALSAPLLTRAPPPLRRRALILALRDATGGRVEISTTLVERIERLVLDDRPAAVDLPGARFRARRHADQLRIEAAPAHRPAVSLTELGLPLTGTVDVPELGLRLTIDEGAPPQDLRQPPEVAVLDLDAVHPPLVLRPPRRGDRFRSLGAPGTRLLSDLFIDRKIPRERRAAWPLVCDADGILWVVGLAIADRARVTPATRRTLHLRAEVPP